jgi:hypothetical protein
LAATHDVQVRAGLRHSFFFQVSHLADATRKPGDILIHQFKQTVVSFLFNVELAKQKKYSIII